MVDGRIVDKAVIYITRWRCRTPRDQQGWPKPSPLCTLPPISYTFNINGDLHTSTQHSSRYPISFASVRRRSDEATFAQKDELGRRLLGISRQVAMPADSADLSSVAIKVPCKRWFADERDLSCTRTRACHIAGRVEGEVHGCKSTPTPLRHTRPDVAPQHTNAPAAIGRRACRTRTAADEDRARSRGGELPRSPASRVSCCWRAVMAGADRVAIGEGALREARFISPR